MASLLRNRILGDGEAIEISVRGATEDPQLAGLTNALTAAAATFLDGIEGLGRQDWTVRGTVDDEHIVFEAPGNVADVTFRVRKKKPAAKSKTADGGGTSDGGGAKKVVKRKDAKSGGGGAKKKTAKKKTKAPSSVDPHGSDLLS
jgi:hypothetical protein